MHRVINASSICLMFGAENWSFFLCCMEFCVLLAEHFLSGAILYRFAALRYVNCRVRKSQIASFVEMSILSFFVIIRLQGSIFFTWVSDNGPSVLSCRIEMSLFSNSGPARQCSSKKYLRVCLLACFFLGFCHFSFFHFFMFGCLLGRLLVLFFCFFVFLCLLFVCLICAALLCFCLLHFVLFWLGSILCLSACWLVGLFASLLVCLLVCLSACLLVLLLPCLFVCLFDCFLACLFASLLACWCVG